MAPYTEDDVRILFARATEQRALAAEMQEWSRRLRALRRRGVPHAAVTAGDSPVEGHAPELTPA